MCSLALSLLGSCGYRERKVRADALVKAAGKAYASKTAAGLMRIEFAPKPPEGGQAAPQTGGGAGLTLGAFGQGRANLPPQPIAIDFWRTRSQIATLGADGTLKVNTMYIGDVVYLLRTGDVGRRPWVKLNLAEVDARRELTATPPVGTVFFSPQVIVELIASTLSGSVSNMGPETIGEVQTTRYDVNVDWDKSIVDPGGTLGHAARDRAGLPRLTKERGETYERMREAMFVARQIWPAKVWIDTQGLPRRFAVTMDQRVLEPGQIRSRQTLEITLTIDLESFGRPLSIEAPPGDETVQVKGFAATLRETRPVTSGSGRGGGGIPQPPAQPSSPPQPAGAVPQAAGRAGGAA